MKRYIGVILFVTLFITVVSIIAILIARGYNFAGNEVTGILNITSNPEGALILINGEERNNTPRKIELIGGKYEIQITKKNYKEWKKEILVESSIVTDISATLFPNDLNLEQLTFLKLDKAFFSNDGDIAVYTITTEPDPGIWVIKLEKTIFEISSSNTMKVADMEFLAEECRLEKSYDTKISPKNDKAILKCNLQEKEIFYLLDLKGFNQTPININAQIGFNPKEVDFSFNSENLFIIDNEIRANYNTTTKDLSLILRKDTNSMPEITPSGMTFCYLNTAMIKNLGICID